MVARFIGRVGYVHRDARAAYLRLPSGHFHLADRNREIMTNELFIHPPNGECCMARSYGMNFVSPGGGAAGVSSKRPPRAIGRRLRPGAQPVQLICA
jgi:hypothetical protein